MEEIRVSSNSPADERAAREEFARAIRECPIPDGELLDNVGLFLNRRTLSRILFFQQLYQQIVHVNGVIMEFGARWGQNLALFEAFRAMYEPTNYTRKIIGFDTFSGFPSVHAKDGDAAILAEGAYSVTEGYEAYLQNVLSFHEQQSPISHIRKSRLVKGDAIQTVGAYLEEHPETMIALAYFDFDLYEPTKKCLEAILPHLTRGSVIGFDELNCAEFPGETLAVREVLDLSRFRVIRSPHTPLPSYIVYE